MNSLHQISYHSHIAQKAILELIEILLDTEALIEFSATTQTHIMELITLKHQADRALQTPKTKKPLK